MLDGTKQEDGTAVPVQAKFSELLQMSDGELSEKPKKTVKP